MGQRGKPPTPTAVLESRGSWRANLNENEPLPERLTPTEPQGLCDVAHGVWCHVVPILERMGVLTEADGYALERYCVLYAQWHKIKGRLNQLKGFSFPIKNKKGETVAFREIPELALSLKVAGELTRLENLFGLNPSARARIQVAPGGGRELLNGESRNDTNGSEQLKRLGLASTIDTGL